MPTNHEILRSTIKTTTIGTPGAGLLSPEQFDAFYELAEEATPWAGLQRVERLENHTGGVPRIDYGDDVIRPAVEGVDSGNFVLPSHDFVPYIQKKGRVAFKLTREALTQNADDANYETRLINGFTRAWGRSKQKVNWLGDETSTDPMLLINDGWIKVMNASGNPVDGSTINAGDIDIEHFQAAFAALPEAWKQRSDELRWAMTRLKRHQYIASLSGRATGMGDLAIERGASGELMIQGIEVVDVPSLTRSGNQDMIALTSPRNTTEVIDPTSMSFRRVDDGVTLVAQDAVAFIGFYHSDPIMVEPEGTALIHTLNN